MSTIKRRHVLNRYYKITRFYEFLRAAAIKGGATLSACVLIFLIVDYKFLDTGALFQSLVNNYSTSHILTVFFVSETVLGLIPPEIFIGWSAKMSQPWLYLFILASLSYLGGVLAYIIGIYIYRIPSVKTYMNNKVSRHIANLRKWGGVFVVIGALLPLPHSIVSLTCGMIQYSFRNYLLWALFRYLRFVIYGLLIFSVI